MWQKLTGSSAASVRKKRRQVIAALVEVSPEPIRLFSETLKIFERDAYRQRVDLLAPGNVFYQASLVVLQEPNAHHQELIALHRPCRVGHVLAELVHREDAVQRQVDVSQ